MLERLYADVTPEIGKILDHSLDGRELSEVEAAKLLSTEGADLWALCRAADLARFEDNGDDVSFVICRNMNFTNVCYVGCSFCGFSRHRDDEDAYDHDHELLIKKAEDAIKRGATEVCIQGGIDPKKNHNHYRNILIALKEQFPNLHIHAFSPEEIDFSHKKSGMELADYLRWLKDAGLGTMPGTAAEILDDTVRKVISPRKLMRDRWVEIIKTAHSVGLNTTSTVMYGHIETFDQIAAHLGIIREIQKETGGFTEFVPLGFIHEKNTLFNHMGARPGAGATEDLRVVAVSRLFLRPHITNIQMSWVKMGHKLAQMALQAGCNDFGGTLMEESISRESGANHGENTPAEEMRRLIREVGRIPIQRDTAYKTIARFDDPQQDPPSLEPLQKVELSGPTRWRLQEEKNRSKQPGINSTPGPSQTGQN